MKYQHIIYIFILILLIYVSLHYQEEYNNYYPIDWVVGWISPTEISNCKNKNNIQRFRDNNELKYCLKSIYKYAPWINKIYIILGGNSEIPIWYKPTNRIIFIPETSLYKNIQSNSETKKLFYHLIPNLSEHFITGDDDFFLGNYVSREEFFRRGKPILNSVHCEYDGKGHIPLAWCKTSYSLAVHHINFNHYLTMGCSRKNPWVPMKKYLLHNNLVIKGNCKGPDMWIHNGNNKFTTFLFSQIIRNKSKFICINDDWDVNNPEKYDKQYKQLQQFFITLYPNKYNFYK